MVVDFDWCALHPDSSFALYGLLTKVGSALIGVNFLRRVMDDKPGYFFLVS